MVQILHIILMGIYTFTHPHKLCSKQKTTNPRTCYGHNSNTCRRQCRNYLDPDLQFQFKLMTNKFDNDNLEVHMFTSLSTLHRMENNLRSSLTKLMLTQITREEKARCVLGLLEFLVVDLWQNLHNYFGKPSIAMFATHALCDAHTTGRPLPDEKVLCVILCYIISQTVWSWNFFQLSVWFLQN